MELKVKYIISGDSGYDYVEVDMNGTNEIVKRLHNGIERVMKSFELYDTYSESYLPKVIDVRHEFIDTLEAGFTSVHLKGDKKAVDKLFRELEEVIEEATECAEREHK